MKSDVLLPYKFTLLSNGNILYSWLNFVLLPYKFTLLSNAQSKASRNVLVLLPYKFTLLSNEALTQLGIPNVLLPYKFTLLSNKQSNTSDGGGFYYPINLHYSQTPIPEHTAFRRFYYPINLHYSQTFEKKDNATAFVLLPYKFTLLSNLKFGKATLLAVYLHGRNYHYNITFSIMSQLYNAQIIINNYSFFESCFSLV